MNRLNVLSTALLDRKWFFILVFAFQLSVGLYYGNEKGNWPLMAFDKDFVLPAGMELEFGDSYAYNNLAYSIVENQEYVNPAGQTSAWVTPGYPLFLALIYSLFGYHYWVVIFIQALLHTLSIWLVYKVVEVHVNSFSALLAVGLFILNFRMMVYTSLVYTEILFFFCLALSVFLLFRSDWEEISIRTMLILGLVGGFGFLVRPVLLPFLLVVGLFLLFRQNKFRFKSIWFAVFLSLLPTIWLLRNYHHFDRLVISTNPEITMSTSIYHNSEEFDFFAPYTLDGYSIKHQNPVFAEGISWLDQKSKDSRLDLTPNYPQGYVYEPFAGEFASKFNVWRKNNLGEYLLRTTYLYKVLLLPYTSDMSPRNQLFSMFIWLFTFPTAFLGLALRDIRRTRLYQFSLISGLLLLIIPATVIVDANLRYQLPTQFMLTIASAITLSYVWLRLISKSSTKDGDIVVAE